MAMELTHIRFAHDLKQVLHVQNESFYYAGAVYPDSRYITNIDRSLTHGGKSPNDPFTPGLSDFEKGWATHLFYDRKAHPQYVPLSPWSMEEAQQGNHVWQFMSAVKIVEDLQSYDVMNGKIGMILNISFPIYPSNEDPQTMQKYSDIQKTLYHVKPTLEDYRIFWNNLSRESGVIDSIMEYAKNLLHNDMIQQKIKVIYPMVLDEILRIH
ncbi:MAG: hypothetical protein UT30_C0001G0009 [Candidatus Uhrbacteria bacterium GW2011_GWF2_39_13]|uniref:Phospholipase C/D domain-containing protein n=1 Tax=Candidatus Uhrbacteria bacterium GW2011_GWF2_39_13 TaxID=1618995 RepID=A0A0G0Q3Q2_9BACT|nr:MAG: hypothetical protein UT30_C0001G0009 [Candidatus Uhrbacteria bacterium GW2011_GWF2_39_13]HAU66333.1 hypothetical protein [Candidatus Uhrbacteria bacterium]